MEDSRWQTELSSLKERNLHAFNNSLFCDVEFFVMDSNGNKVTLQAHKYVLAISSPVFEAMFYGELAETGRTIDLPDCTKEGLQELLHYVYSDEVNLTGRNVMDVLYAAQKYMMPFIEEKCNEYLQKDLEPEDVFFVLPQAQQTKNDKAELCCWNVIDFETQRAVTSEPFLNISHELLCQVLERETLHVEEVNLFKAVDKWASNQIQEKEQKDDGSAKRTALGEDVIRLIRFPVMSHHEFAEFVLDSNILLLHEVNEVVKILSSATTSDTVFLSKKREGQWSEKWSRNRFENLSDNQRLFKFYKTKRDQRHCLQFQVNKPIFFAGVRLFWNQSQEIEIKLTISKQKRVRISSLYVQPKRSKSSDNGFGSFSVTNTESPGFITCTELTLREKKTKLIDFVYQGFTVLFDDPVPLEPNEWYAIEAKLNNYSAFGGSEGRYVIKCDDITITFRNADEDDNCTTVENGQFPSFLLKRKIGLKEQAKPFSFGLFGSPLHL